MKKLYFFLLLIGISHCSEPPKKKIKIQKIKRKTKKKRSKKKKFKQRIPLELVGKVRILGNPQLLAPGQTIKMLMHIKADTPCVWVAAMNLDASYYEPNNWHSQGHPLLACDDENILGINIFPTYLPLSWFENKKDGDQIKFLLYLPNKQRRLVTLTCAYCEFHTLSSGLPKSLEEYIQQLNTRLEFIQNHQKSILKKIKKKGKKRKRKQSGKKRNPSTSSSLRQGYARHAGQTGKRRARKKQKAEQKKRTKKFRPGNIFYPESD